MGSPFERADIQSGTPSAVSTGATSAAGESPPTGLDGVVANQQSAVDQVMKDLETAQAAVKKSTEQAGLLKADLSLAKKAADDSAAAKGEAVKALAEAKDASDGAHDLIDKLGREASEKLAAKIGDIHEEYQRAVHAQVKADDALRDHDRAREALEAKVAEAKKERGAVQGKLSELPAETKQLTATVKELTRELNAASGAGQTLKALVQQSRLDEAYRSPAPMW